MAVADQGMTPLGFINRLNKQKHVVLFYEDESYAERIEFRLIEQGLRKKERGIYATFGEEEAVRNRMDSYGIDVEHYKKNDLLRIVKLNDPTKNPAGLETGLATGIKRLFDGWDGGSLRVVARAVPKIETEEEIRANMNAEMLTHASFEMPTSVSGNRNLILMCPYPISGIVPEKHAEWFRHLMRHHHAAIFAPRTSAGIALELGS